MSLAQARRWVYDIVNDGVSIGLDNVDHPVYLWLPASMDDLPCYVVGRPDMDEGSTRSLQAVSVPVYALGRVLRDDDAQEQLDAMADHLVGLLWKPIQRAVASLRLTRMRSTVVTIASVEVPAYTGLVVGSVQPCTTQGA